MSGARAQSTSRIAGRGAPSAIADVSEARSGLTLAPGDVHIWVIPLAAAARWVSVLPRADVERAAQFRSNDRRNQFKSSRAASRLLLARYLGVDHGALSFGQGANGKPHVVCDGTIEFNLSHTQTTVVVAIARDLKLGVDIEPRHDVPEFERITRDFFAPAEREALSRIAQPRRNDAFLQAWTRKEALAKATGIGIAASLGGAPTLSPDAADGQPIVFRETPVRGGSWYLHDLDAIPGHVGALAVSRRRARILWRSLDESPDISQNEGYGLV
jgi:4'-phosphopantetheinyl transferase